MVCQNQLFDSQSKIIDVYGEDWYQSRLNESNSILLLLDKYIKFGFKLEDIIQEKYDDSNALIEIEKSDKSGLRISIDAFLEDYNSTNFNVLKYLFFPSEEEQIIFLKDKLKIIRIKSIHYLQSL